MAKANCLALSILVVLSFAAFAAAQSYTVTDLGPGQAFAINGLGDVVVQPYPSGNSFVWAPGGKQLSLTPLTAGYPTTPYGINNQGLVVGLSSNGQGFAAALWTNGVPLDLGNLGVTGCAGTGINASAEVAGYCFLLTGRTEAFLWSKATGMQGLGSLQGGGSIAQAINRFGQVVGYSPTSANTTPYAFIWSKTTGMKNLGTLPRGGVSYAFAINDLGQVAGGSDCGTGCHHAALWSKTKGSMLDLGVLPGAKGSDAFGINNVGQVVGNSDGTFVWSPSTGMLDLNSLIPANSGWVLQSANAINDKGQIVGYGTLNGQSPEAFLLTPQ
jgi:probable HAF family extracellular repeat protein